MRACIYYQLLLKQYYMYYYIKYNTESNYQYFQKYIQLNSKTRLENGDIVPT